MFRVVLYSLLLLGGMVVAFFADLTPYRWAISTLTIACLAYIMIEVGLEFTINKRKLRSYGWDYVVAATAAGFPWIFCALYFIVMFNKGWPEALLLGRFAAPTSAGVLFTMLAAAGLGTTWLFKKARILAIFDDLDTILLMIPLQIMVVGLKWQLIVALPVLAIFLLCAYIFLHRLRWPITPLMIFCYGAIIVFTTELVYWSTEIHIEVLMPSFVLGCMLYNPHDPNRPKLHEHEHAYIEPEAHSSRVIDSLIKGMFMFLVGASLPKVELGDLSWQMALFHVVMITVLSNVGKMFPAFCYRKDASMRERIALSIAMFPRGEVGAGVLLVTISYGIAGPAITIAGLSLALNLLLTGLFTLIVVRLLKGTRTRTPSG